MPGVRPQRPGRASTVQTAGFEDDGLLHLDLGSREYVGRITPADPLELTRDAGKGDPARPAPMLTLPGPSIGVSPATTSSPTDSAALAVAW